MNRRILITHILNIGNMRATRSEDWLEGEMETIHQMFDEYEVKNCSIAVVSGSLFSDTVIDDESWNKYPQNIYNDGEDSIFAEGARWMREKIKQELAKQ